MWIRSLVSIACLVSLDLGVAEAADTWSDPAPGVRRLHRTTSNQNINVLVVDLCAPGIGVRGTKSSERGRTVGSFGSAVGAIAAVNGDFFRSGYDTDGPSRGAGNAWGGGDHGYVAPLAFGPHRASLARHEDQAGAPDWATEVVSGHPSIVVDGTYRNNDGDSLCSARHPRTAAGLSADRKKLVLAVVDGRATTRIGMTCGELAGLMQEMGAHDVVNLDGGGSSTMWLGGGTGTVNRPSDGSPRVVGNHLAIVSTGNGDAPFCPSAPPQGYLDSASCERLVGWAQDVDVPDAALPVEVWVGGPPGSDAPHFTATANVHRDDLCDALGSCEHGFSIRTPHSIRDNTPHEVWIEGTDNYGVANALLRNAPQTVQCEPAAPPFPDGKRRWVTNPQSFAAWRLTSFDLAKPAQAVVDSVADGPDLPATPDLARIENESAVYVVDGTILRHVRSPEAMAAWRFPFDSVRVMTAGEASAFVIGAAWPDDPYLMLDAPTGKVFFVDKGDPTEPDPEPDTMASGGCATTGDTSAIVALLLLVALRRRR